MNLNSDLETYVKKLTERLCKLGVLGICLYGTGFKGRKSEQSDIDIIVVCKKEGVIGWEADLLAGKRVHITIVALDILEKDALFCDKGTYYIGKFINPHTFLYAATGFKNIFNKLFCEFLESYVFPEIETGKRLKVENIIGLTYFVHYKEFPDYLLPLSKWICSQDNVEAFRAVISTFRDSLAYSKRIKIIGNRNF